MLLPNPWAVCSRALVTILDPQAMAMTVTSTCTVQYKTISINYRHDLGSPIKNGQGHLLAATCTCSLPQFHGRISACASGRVSQHTHTHTIGVGTWFHGFVKGGSSSVGKKYRGTSPWSPRGSYASMHTPLIILSQYAHTHKPLCKSGGEY